ncbi:MAG: phage replisome organizer N-terminal domain-containing protein [Clostridia bacterium]|nr:phage replisome organizer N-terminal domain-containing protein [Clostridia bacterium]
MFDKRKIKKLRRLPAGNDILLIWVMLLAMAGKCNAGGMIFITERVPFTEEDLAEELDFEVNTIRLALQAFENFDMISFIDGGFINITGWEEHQNIDGLEKIKEQNRLRQAKNKQKQKLLASYVTANVTDNVTVTQGNATEVDKEKDKEKELELDVAVATGGIDTDQTTEEDDFSTELSTDNQFVMLGGTLGRGVVKLTPKQDEALLEKLGFDGYNYYIPKLADFIIQNDAKIGNHYAMILKWAEEDAKV